MNDFFLNLRALLVGETRVPLSAFMCAIQMQELDDIDEDEIECIVATLIAEVKLSRVHKNMVFFKKKIKGYISHGHQILVLSKQQPFPPLSSITSLK